MRTLLYTGAMFALLISCQQENDLTTGPPTEKEIIAQQNIKIIEQEVTSLDLKKIKAAGFSTEKVKHLSKTVDDVITDDFFLIEGDIMLSQKQLDQMAIPNGNISSNGRSANQYSTNNLINVPNGVRTIKILPYTQETFLWWTYRAGELSNREKSLLKEALVEYNNQKLNIKFEYTEIYAENDPDYIKIYSEFSFLSFLGVIAMGEFPSNGNPGKTIKCINLNLAPNKKHVFLHEIGHNIGFRHTDWFNVCGSGSNEGDAGVGAKHIEGTPKGKDNLSFMISCVKSTNTGTFTKYDEIALQKLYGKKVVR